MADKCKRCNGTGKEPDLKGISRKLRARRQRLAVGLRTMASILGISASYLSQLERAERKWSDKLLARYYVYLHEIERSQGPEAA